MIDIDNPRIEFLGADGTVQPNDEGAVAFQLPDFGLMFALVPTRHDSHKAALAAVEKLHLLGFKDWRVPSSSELGLLVNRNQHSPATHPVLAAHTPTIDWYWTSTIHASSAACAWLVDFFNGYVYYGHRYGSGFVRAVRSVSSPPSQ